MLFLISDGSYINRGTAVNAQKCDAQKCVVVEANHKDDYPVISAAQLLISKYGVDKDEITINLLNPPCGL